MRAMWLSDNAPARQQSSGTFLVCLVCLDKIGRISMVASAKLWTLAWLPNSCILSCIPTAPVWLPSYSSCIHTALAWLPNFELLYPLMYTHSSYMAPMVLNLLNQWLTSSADTTPTFQGGCSGWTACVQSSFWEQRSTLDMWVNVMCHVRWHVWHHSALIGFTHVWIQSNKC